MKTTCIKARFVVGHDGRDHIVYRDGEVVYRGRDIIFCGKRYDGQADETIDAGNAIVCPGFIDLDSDVDTDHALVDVAFPHNPKDRFRMGERFRTEDPYTDDDFRVRQTYSMAQLIKNGITTCMPIEGEGFHGWSQSYREFDIMAQVALSLGMRLYAGPSFKSYAAKGYPLDEVRARRSLDDAFRYFEDFDGKGDGLIKGFMNPCQINCTTEEALQEAMRFAVEKGIPMRLHACEGLHEWALIKEKGGRSTIEYFDKLGLLTPQLLIPHCITARDSEIRLLAERGVSIISTPIAEINGGTVLYSYAKYQHLGVNLTIGTDAQPDDMIQNMRMAWSIDRALLRGEMFLRYPEEGDAYSLREEVYDYPRVRAADIFRAATTNGAKALGRDDIGRLAVGCKADITIVNLNDLAVGPTQDPIRTLIMSCVGNNVSHTIINGELLMRDRKLIGVDEDALMLDAQRVYDRYNDLHRQYDADNRPIEAYFPPEFPIV